MRLRDISARALLLGVVLSGSGHAASAQTMTAGAMRAFQSIDTDGDHRLDRQELIVAAGRDFVRLDIDHDGTLTKRELAKTRSAVLLLPFPRRFDTMASFAAADTDHDGKIDKREYVFAVVKAYMACDANRDGTIEMSDLRRCAM
jgi:hypothetical protein